MADIKGRALLDTLAAIKERVGEQELSKIVKSLSNSSRVVFESSILFSEWYPLDAFAEFLEADVRETANGDREALAKRSEKVVETHTSGESTESSLSLARPDSLSAASPACTKPISEASRLSRNLKVILPRSNILAFKKGTALWNPSSWVSFAQLSRFPVQTEWI